MDPDPDSDPDAYPSIFISDLQDADKKIILKRSHETVEIKVFLNIIS
jgi:hypothetical protein